MLPADPAAHLSARLFSRRLARLLSQNTAISCCTFLIGLAMMWGLVRFAGTGKYPATAISFVAATSLHYVAARSWMYPDSRRELASGYLYFFVNAGVGLLATMASFALLNGALGMNYIAARVVASLFAGLAAFLLNALFNFKGV